MNKVWLDVSEVVRFYYSPRGWEQDRRQAQDSGRLRGRHHHATRGALVRSFIKRSEGANKHMLIGVVCALASIGFYTLAYNGAFDAGKWRPWLLSAYAGSLTIGLFQFRKQARLNRAMRVDAKSHGLPDGEILYSDDPFVDESLGLRGKPDYIVKTPEGIVPVEVKSGGPRPEEGDVLQLMCYCILAHSTYAERPPGGVIEYANRPPVPVPFTAEDEAWARHWIQKVRRHAEEIDGEDLR